MSERFRPFPNIVRYPAEGNTPAETAQEGAPASAAESVFLSVPELAASAHAALTLRELNRAGRDRLTERYVRLAATDPNTLIDFFDSLRTLEESGVYPHAAELRQTVESALARMVVKELPSAAVMEQWLTLYTESAVYKPLAEKILHRFVERCKTPKDIVQLMYRLAEGGFRSSNVDIIKQTLHVIGFETPVFDPTSPQAAHYMLAMFDRDDAILKDAMEIDGAFFYIAHCYEPELLQRIDAAQDTVNRQPGFEEALLKIASADRERFEKLMHHYSRTTQGGRVASIEGTARASDFPLNLMVGNIGPLRSILNEFMAMRMLEETPGQLTANLNLPEYSGVRGADSIPGLGDTVHEFALRPRTETLLMDQASHIRTLAYLVPHEMRAFTEWDRFADANAELRREMTENSPYLLSPRGDQVEITDALLRERGYHDITFQMDPRNKRQTVVTLTVGNNCQFRLLLDEHFAVREVQSMRGIHLPPHGAFLEHVILSHLREIRCSERVNETGNSGAPANPGESRRAFTSRRAHRRILPVGQSPTSAQIARILGEYDVDLVRMNRERAAAGEARKVTYVYEVESVAVAGARPVRSQTPDATRRLRNIIGAE